MIRRPALAGALPSNTPCRRAPPGTAGLAGRSLASQLHDAGLKGVLADWLAGCYAPDTPQALARAAVRQARPSV